MLLRGRGIDGIDAIDAIGSIDAIDSIDSIDAIETIDSNKKMLVFIWCFVSFLLTLHAVNCNCANDR